MLSQKQLLIEAETSRGFIAIDDIGLTPGLCQGTAILFFCCIPFFLSKASYRKYFVFFLTQLMKQIWGLWVARLRMAHVTGRTSVLASVGG